MSTSTQVRDRDEVADRTDSPRTPSLYQKVAEFDLMRSLATAVNPHDVDTGQSPSLVEWVRSLWQRDRARFFIVLGALGALVALIVVGVATGWLSSTYRAIYTAFPGRPWTHVFRENPWVYGLGILGMLAISFAVVRRARWRALIATAVWFAAGFVSGHVLW